MSSGKVLLGVLAGVAVGATLGILFAPAKGAATRRMISKKGDDYAEELGEKFDTLVNGMKEKFETVKGEASRMAGKAKVRAEEVVGHDGTI